MNRLSSHKFLAFSALVALPLLFAGCGEAGPPDERPERVAFGGVAKLNGAAVTDALITFHPAGNGPGASGKTDASGNFQMSTYEANDGVVPGDYTVTVTKVVNEPAAAEAVEDSDPSYDGAPAEATSDEENKLPPKFEDPATSGVKVTVTEANTDFTLEFK